MRFLLHCFFNRSLSATDSTVRHREPVSVFTFSCEDASIAPELFYAQSSVEFHARLSVFKGGRIGKSVCGVHSDMQPRWDRIHVPFVKRRGSVSRLFFGSTIIIWKFLQGKALARMPLCQAKYYKSSLVSSLSSDFSRTKPPFFLSQWIVNRLLRFSAVSNVAYSRLTGASVERGGRQSLRPVQARVHSWAKGLVWSLHRCPVESVLPRTVTVAPQFAQKTLMPLEEPGTPTPPRTVSWSSRQDCVRPTFCPNTLLGWNFAFKAALMLDNLTPVSVRTLLETCILSVLTPEMCSHLSAQCSHSSYWLGPLKNRWSSCFLCIWGPSISMGFI